MLGDCTKVSPWVVNVMRGEIFGGEEIFRDTGSRKLPGTFVKGDYKERRAGSLLGSRQRIGLQEPLMHHAGLKLSITTTNSLNLSMHLKYVASVSLNAKLQSGRLCLIWNEICWSLHESSQLTYRYGNTWFIVYPSRPTCWNWSSCPNPLQY